MIPNVTYRIHALQRMYERKIGEDEVETVLAAGEVIEDYPNDFPYPSKLLLGWTNTRALHVVAAYNAKENETIVVTTYEPDAEKWDENFRRRKQK